MNKTIIIAAIIIAFVSGIAGGLVVKLVGGNQSVGAVTPGSRFPHGITIGLASNSPTNISDIKVGTCSLIAASFTLAASTSLPFDCAVTGVSTGDVVFGSFATSSSNGSGWAVTQASASSTSGFLTFRVVNNTGTSALIPASIASSTPYLVYKVQ